MNLRGQKRLAAEIMGVGINKVRINPEMQEDVSKSITRDDIRYHIATGAINAKPEKGISRGRLRKRIGQKAKGRSKGHGHRSGTKFARKSRKSRWMSKIRAIRDELRKMKETNEVTVSEYRKLYRQAKGNLFHSRKHLRESVKRTSKI